MTRGLHLLWDTPDAGSCAAKGMWEGKGRPEVRASPGRHADEPEGGIAAADRGRKANRRGAAERRAVGSARPANGCHAAPLPQRQLVPAGSQSASTS